MKLVYIGIMLILMYISFHYGKRKATKQILRAIDRAYNNNEDKPKSITELVNILGQYM